MGKYSFKDFRVVDQVYHLSNTKLNMVIISKLEEMNEVTCRWMDGKGEVQTLEFMPEELGKHDDLGPMIRRVSMIP